MAGGIDFILLESSMSMLFIAFIRTIPGSSRHLIRRIKTLREPEGIKIEKILALFGDYDFIIFFHAENHDFVDRLLSPLKEVAYIKVRSATDIENLKWTFN